MLPHFRFTRQHSPLITPLCYLVEVVPYPFQFRDKFFDTVQFLKTDPKARYQGYTFFFREGFCWNNVLNPNARLLKAKMKSASVNDVGSMSLSSLSEFVPNYYLVCLLNSELLFDYYREFINCTVNIQINDIRQIPVIIPSAEELSKVKTDFENAVNLKKSVAKNKATEESISEVHP